MRGGVATPTDVDARRVGGFAADAVMVGGEIIRRAISEAITIDASAA